MSYQNDIIFRSDVTIQGKHARYMTALVENQKIFSRNIDVYMTAPIIGFVNNKQGAVDFGENGEYQGATRKIGTEALLGEEKNLTTIFRTIIFLHNQEFLDVDERAELAFREDQKVEVVQVDGVMIEEKTKKHKENMEVFNSYALGGIEILYNEIVKDAVEEMDYIINILGYVERFRRDFMPEASEAIVKKLMSDL